MSTPKTKNGHDMFESLSALQKCVRRGLEEQALYWASELDRSGYSQHLWNRLRIIASEDVGLAESNVAVQIRTLYHNWQEAPENKLWVMHAILILVRAPKSRIVDHAACLFYSAKRPTFEVPDFALDKHTYRGRKMGRGIDQFFAEDGGGMLVNQTLEDPYKARALEACKHPMPKEKPAAPKADTRSLLDGLPGWPPDA